jgi:hypothetical protein
MITKPLLLLDVDGVLIPYAARERPAGFLTYTLLGEDVWLAAQHGAWLLPLCEQFQLVWATGWEHDANRLIAPILGLPMLPVIEFPRDAIGRFAKLPTIQRIAGDQPLAWLDDELRSDAYAWAASRRAPTLLIDVDPAVGLTQEIVAMMVAFAQTIKRGEE